MNSRVLLIAIALLMGLYIFDGEAAMACPTCKEGISNHVAMGYAISILFMMGMPFLIFGFWVVTILRLRANAQSSPYRVNQRVIESSASPNFEL